MVIVKGSGRSQYNGPADLRTSGRLVGQDGCDRQAEQRCGCHITSDPVIGAIGRLSSGSAVISRAIRSMDSDR